MRAQDADSVTVRLVASLEDAWMQMINLVESYANLEASSNPVRQLRLFISR
jgi:hypothetical protein